MAAGSFEDVLAEALVAHDLEGLDGFERVIAAHSEHAAGLRSHLERLRCFGLVSVKTQAAPPSGATGGFPERLGDFRLLERLGGGGMGVVYLAEQTSLQRRVALKLVRSEHLYYPGAHDRFRREVAAIARLQHPGIVPVFCAGEDAGIPWLAMEHVVGASLDQVVLRLAGRDPAHLTGEDLRIAVGAVVAGRGGGTDPTGGAAHAAPGPGPFAGTWVTVCVRLVRAVALALQHAHERGVLHRDIKPSNLMLTLDGRVMLLDFGLALSDGSARLTGTGNQVGSPAYMSPEQMRGSHKLDARTDVYSLGVTLYELLTLRMPFAGESATSTRDLVLAGRAVPPRLLNRTIPRDADVVCRKAMDVEAGRRYATAAAFAADLDNVVSLRPIAARPPNSWLIARRWAQRHPARAIAVVAAFLLCGVAPTLFLLQQQEAAHLLLLEQQEATRKVTAALVTAKQQRDRAREAVDTMLTRVANESLFDLPRMLAVRRDLLASARSFYERFLAEAADDPELREEAAETALRLANVEGKLGKVEVALATATRAEALARQPSPRPAQDRSLLRHILMVKGSALHSMSRLDEALATLADARTECVATLAENADDAEAHCDRLSIERAVALSLSQLQRYDEAIACYDRMPELWQQASRCTYGTGHHVDGLEEVVCAAADEAELHVARNEVDAAADALERGQELAAGIADSQRSRTFRLAVVKMHVTRARLATAANRLDEAEAHLREALANTRTLLDDFPDYVLVLRARAALLNDLAVCLDRSNRGDEAMPLYDESIAVVRRLIEVDRGVAENRANLAASLVNVGSRLMDQEKLAAARALFEEAIELATSALAEAPTRDGWRTVAHNAIWFLGQVCGQLGDHVAQAAAAERLAAVRPDQARTLRIAAELLAGSIAALANDPAWTGEAREGRRQQLEQRAMAILQDAARLGCTDLAWLATGAPFAPLRSLPGFPAILRQVEANVSRQATGK